MARQGISSREAQKVKNRLIKWTYLLLRIGFGSLLIYASIYKIGSPFEFAEAVENYRIFGTDLSLWTAVFIPYLEAIIGFALLSGLWSETVVLLNAVLMFLFLILVIQAYIRGLDIRCGCFFAEGESRIGLLKIFENVLFVVLSISLIKLNKIVKHS